jgi:hypothetical protein
MRILRRAREAFEQSVLEDFEGRMSVHLRKFFPAACAALGDEQVLALVRYGVERAESHGITRERGVCTWVDLMFTFGRDFDRDPGLPWASDFLSRKDVPNQRARIERLFARALEHRDEARGVRLEGAPP